MAWPHNIRLFQDFINTLNSHHPSIQVKYTIDANRHNFLDTAVFFQPTNAIHKKLPTEVYFKATDTRALLHKNSYHHKDTFRGIIKSQLICCHRISSKDSFKQPHVHYAKALDTEATSNASFKPSKNSTLASLAPIRSPDHQTTLWCSGPGRLFPRQPQHPQHPSPPTLTRVCIPAYPPRNRVCIPTPPLPEPLVKAFLAPLTTTTYLQS